MAWTQYHDSLMQEAIALMTEPQWFSQPSITDRLTAIRNELQTAGQSLNVQQDQRIQTLLKQFEDAYTAGKTANETRYGDLTSGYSQRATDLLGTTKPYSYGSLPGRYDSLAQQQQTDLGNVVGGYQSRQTQLQGLLDQLGGQSRADLQQRYTQQRAQAENDLIGRGLGNTTIRSGVMSGINTRENQDIARFDEGLRREKLGYMNQWMGDTLGSQERAAGQNAQMGLQGLQARSRYADLAKELTLEPLGVIERRTDVTPSLADLANLSMQLGRGSANTFALPAMNALMTFSNPGSFPQSGLFGR